jgi:tRNA pseudouridine38-40 synthase
MENIITRYKLTIEYDGTNYCGFQKQTAIEENSVEEILEEAVFKMTQSKIKIFV